MKKIFLTFIAIIAINACKNNNLITSNINVIEIDISDTIPVNFMDIFDKIEVISLETQKESLIDNIRKIQIGDEDEIIIIDKTHTVFIFNKEGYYIKNNVQMVGRGPNQYYIAVDILFNHYTKQIEIMTNDNQLVTIDKKLDFISIHRFNSDNKRFRYAYPLSDSTYVLYPLQEYLDSKYYVYDKNEAKIINSYTIPSSCLMSDASYPFQYDRGKIFFRPGTISYTTYEMNSLTGEIQALDSLGLGKNSFDNEIIRNYDQGNVIDYMFFKSNLFFEYGMLMSRDFLVCKIVKNAWYRTLIYDRNTKKVNIYSNQLEKRIPSFIYFKDNVLYSFLNPEQIQMFIDERLISQNNLEKINNAKPEDNPLLLKYYLKNNTGTCSIKRKTD